MLNTPHSTLQAPHSARVHPVFCTPSTLDPSHSAFTFPSHTVCCSHLALFFSFHTFHSKFHFLQTHLRSFYSALYNVQFTLHTPHPTLYKQHLYTRHPTPQTVYPNPQAFSLHTLHNSLLTLYTPVFFPAFQSTLHTFHPTHCTHCLLGVLTFYIVPSQVRKSKFIQHIVHPTFPTSHCSLNTFFSLHTIHSTHCTFHPTIYIWNSRTPQSTL